MLTAHWHSVSHGGVAVIISPPCDKSIWARFFCDFGSVKAKRAPDARARWPHAVWSSEGCFIRVVSSVLFEVFRGCKGVLKLTETPTECGPEPRARAFVVGFAFASALGPQRRPHWIPCGMLLLLLLILNQSNGFEPDWFKQVYLSLIHIWRCRRRG